MGPAAALAAALVALPVWAAAGPTDPSKGATPLPGSSSPTPGKKAMPELPSPYTPNLHTKARFRRPAVRPPDFAYGAYQRGQYVTAFREATKRVEGESPRMRRR